MSSVYKKGQHWHLVLTPVTVCSACCVHTYTIPFKAIAPLIMVFPSARSIWSSPPGQHLCPVYSIIRCTEPLSALGIHAHLLYYTQRNSYGMSVSILNSLDGVVVCSNGQNTALCLSRPEDRARNLSLNLSIRLQLKCCHHFNRTYCEIQWMKFQQMYEWHFYSLSPILRHVTHLHYQ